MMDDGDDAKEEEEDDDSSDNDIDRWVVICNGDDMSDLQQEKYHQRYSHVALLSLSCLHSSVFW
jgi:hypothetical protein